MENPCTVRLSLPKRDIFRRTNTILKCYPFSKNFRTLKFSFLRFSLHSTAVQLFFAETQKKYRTKKILDERNVRRCAHVHEKNPTIPLFPTAHNIRTKEEIVCYFQCAEANEEWKRKNEKKRGENEFQCIDSKEIEINFQIICQCDLANRRRRSAFVAQAASIWERAWRGDFI